ncbi:hypothetical protein B0H13DRAFT_1915223 [Mycena leptocephala]|nr:hypothetical protein B0H13DRAFT_1915223 [Mycena leptocephala]
MPLLVVQGVPAFLAVNSDSDRLIPTYHSMPPADKAWINWLWSSANHGLGFGDNLRRASHQDGCLARRSLQVDREYGHARIFSAAWAVYDGTPVHLKLAALKSYKT